MRRFRHLVRRHLSERRPAVDARSSVSKDRTTAPRRPIVAAPRATQLSRRGGPSQLPQWPAASSGAPASAVIQSNLSAVERRFRLPFERKRLRPRLPAQHSSAAEGIREVSLFGDYLLNLRPSGAFMAKAKGASSTTALYSAINSPRRPVDAVAHQPYLLSPSKQRSP
jgi:hypothetical protein